MIILNINYRYRLNGGKFNLVILFQWNFLCRGFESDPEGMFKFYSHLPVSVTTKQVKAGCRQFAEIGQVICGQELLQTPFNETGIPSKMPVNFPFRGKLFFDFF